jgi:hypothetical protein
MLHLRIIHSTCVFCPTFPLILLFSNTTHVLQYLDEILYIFIA